MVHGPCFQKKSKLPLLHMNPLVDPLKRRDRIRKIIEAYEHKHPEAAQAAAASARGMTRSRANKFAVDDKSAYSDVPIQWGFRLPGGLFRMLDNLIAEPKFLHDEDEYKWFLKEYKRYRIPEKI